MYLRVASLQIAAQLLAIAELNRAVHAATYGRILRAAAEELKQEC